MSWSRTLLLSSLLLSEASAHDRSWPGQRLAVALPEASTFTQRQSTLTAAQAQWVEAALGEPIRAEDRAPTFYVGSGKDGRSVGVVVFLDADGTNGNVEMADALDPGGKLLRVVLFEHSEGAALGKAAFLDQFAGKAAGDVFRVGTYIEAPSGQSSSAQIVATAARRGALLGTAALRLGVSGGAQ